MLGLVADGFYWGQHAGRTLQMNLPGKVQCERMVGSRGEKHPCERVTTIHLDGSSS
jgi:hypothetical protein